MTEQHAIAFQLIMAFYGEDYMYSGRRLLIRRRLANDLDLLANYTEKAELLRERLEKGQWSFTPSF
jgi:hypothetical protein